MLAYGRNRGEGQKRQISVSEDGHQQVVEVVGDPSGKYAQTLELLHFPHLHLDPSPRGDVPNVHEIPDGGFRRGASQGSYRQVEIGSSAFRRPVQLALPDFLEIEEQFIAHALASEQPRLKFPVQIRILKELEPSHLRHVGDPEYVETGAVGVYQRALP